MYKYLLTSSLMHGGTISIAILVHSCIQNLNTRGQQRVTKWTRHLWGNSSRAKDVNPVGGAQHNKLLVTLQPPLPLSAFIFLLTPLRQPVLTQKDSWTKTSPCRCNRKHSFNRAQLPLPPPQVQLVWARSSERGRKMWKRRSTTTLDLCSSEREIRVVRASTLEKCCCKGRATSKVGERGDFLRSWMQTLCLSTAVVVEQVTTILNSTSGIQTSKGLAVREVRQQQLVKPPSHPLCSHVS